MKFLRKLWQIQLVAACVKILKYQLKCALRSANSKQRNHIAAPHCFCLGFIVSNSLEDKLVFINQTWYDMWIVEAVSVYLPEIVNPAFCSLWWDLYTIRVSQHTTGLRDICFWWSFPTNVNKKSAKMTVQNYLNLSNILGLVIWVEDACKCYSSNKPLHVFIYIMIIIINLSLLK